MAKSRPRGIRFSPRIEGNVEISSSRRYGIFIGGDQKGLCSLGRLLIWLAEFDQEDVPGMPDGERYHVHLYAKEPAQSFGSLTRFSNETEVCRLDAKGTGEFPDRYRVSRKRPSMKNATKKTKGSVAAKKTKGTKSDAQTGRKSFP